MRTIEQLLQQVNNLQERHAKGEDVRDELTAAQADIDQLKNARTGSRFAGPGADATVADHIRKGGTIAPDGTFLDPQGTRVGSTTPGIGGGGAKAAGVQFLRDIVSVKGGDAAAFQRLEQKAWTNAVPGAGGYLVGPDQLPGYVEVRRATSPLRERCRQYTTDRDEVIVNTEGNTITVQHLAEGATKPDTTGSVGQKVSTVHKVAGTSTVSDEHLADSAGTVADLIERQFGAQIGIAIDQKIISGSGTGEPTGIRLAAGVTSTPVDGQTGRELYNSILKAIGRLRERFYDADTIVVAPRDLTKVDTAVSTTNEYLFPGGLTAQFPAGRVVPDGNVPTGLGAGLNESVILIGNFREGAIFVQRQPLTVEASRDVEFRTDQTVFRGVERYGFGVLVPGAFEILTGVLP